MAKKQKTAQSTPSLPALLVAAAFIIIGLAGLAFALRDVAKNSGADKQSDLQVIEGTGQQPHEQTGGAQELQDAARTQDLIQGKDGESVQPGTSVDELLKDKEIR